MSWSGELDLVSEGELREVEDFALRSKGCSLEELLVGSGSVIGDSALRALEGMASSLSVSARLFDEARYQPGNRGCPAGYIELPEALPPGLENAATAASDAAIVDALITDSNVVMAAAAAAAAAEDDVGVDVVAGVVAVGVAGRSGESPLSRSSRALSASLAALLTLPLSDTGRCNT